MEANLFIDVFQWQMLFVRFTQDQSFQVWAIGCDAIINYSKDIP